MTDYRPRYLRRADPVAVVLTGAAVCALVGVVVLFSLRIVGDLDEWQCTRAAYAPVYVRTKPPQEVPGVRCTEWVSTTTGRTRALPRDGSGPTQ